MAFTRDKMNWHPAWNDGPPEGQPERAPTQDENFGSWGQFAAQGGLAQVPAPHPAHPQPPPQQWPGFNVPKPDLQKRIDKTLEALGNSPNPLDFETHLRRKQGDNPDFLFLHPGGVGNDYFEGKKRQIIAAMMKPQLVDHHAPPPSANMGFPPHGPPGHMGEAPPHMPPPPFPMLHPDVRTLEPNDIEKVRDHVKKLNGTKDSIKTVSHWLLSKGDVISGIMRELTNVVQMIDFNNFGKKLHVCYVINDMLHESMKMRESIDILDPVSNGILHALPGIISSSFQGYSPQDQEKMHNLLALWCDRQIFQQEQINYIGSTMINPPSGMHQQPPGWAWGGFNGWMPPPPPSNLLHLSPGFVVDILSGLLENEDFGPYTPIPISHVPPCMPEKIPKTANYILDKYEEFERAMEILDSRFRRRRSRSSSRSRSRERYGRKRGKIRPRDREHSRSTSRSSSSSRSTTPDRRRRRSRS